MERFWQFRFLMIKSLGSTLGALVFVFSMGLPSLSAAGESCVLLLGGKPRLSFKNPPAPEFGRHLQSHIERAVSLSEKLSLPASVQVVFLPLSKLGEYARYNVRTNSMYVADFFLDSANKNAEDAFISTVLHEYAHAIFAANMVEYFPEWKYWYDRLSSKGLLNAIVHALRPPDEPRFLFSLSKPYQELFADLLVAVARHDPRSAVRNWIFIGHDKPEYLEAMDFSGSLLGAKWTTGEYHLLFSPVRKFLWVNYFALPKNKGKESQMFERIFRILMNEISESAVTFPPWTPEQMNHRLLTSLKRELRDFSEDGVQSF
jgi:hypothetical protein